MVQIEQRCNFPLAVGEAFSYITDTANWPAYWPEFIRLECDGAPPWGTPGARVTVVIRLLNRETVLQIELQRFERDRLVQYLSRQQGLPPIQHQRHFRVTPAGCEFRQWVGYQPRTGLKGLFDRFILRRAIAKALQKSQRNLTALLGHAACAAPRQDDRPRGYAAEGGDVTR